MGYRRNQGNVGIFFLLSIVIHLAIAFIWWFQSLNTINLAKKSNNVTISVGLQAALAGTVDMVASNEVMPKPPEVVEEQPVIEETIPTEIKHPEVKKTPPKIKNKKPVIKEKKSEVRSVEPPKEVIKPKVEPKPQEKVEKKQKPAAEETTKSGLSGVNGSAKNEQKTAETGALNQSGGSEEEQFDRYVRQHLLSHKVTNSFRKTRRRKGDVIINFTIDRDGNLVDKEITNSSRVRQFDRAAIKQVISAAPYPKAPKDSTWQQRSFSIVIHYQIN